MCLVKQSKGLISAVLSLWIFVLSTAAVVPSVHLLLHKACPEVAHSECCAHSSSHEHNHENDSSPKEDHVCAVTLLAHGFEIAIAEVSSIYRLGFAEYVPIEVSKKPDCKLVSRACIRAPPIA